MADVADSARIALPVRKTRLRTKLISAVLGTIIALAMLEVSLRIIQPFGSRLQGDRIVLATNRKYRIHNPGLSKIDAEILHSKNSLGFRGPEPPQDMNAFLTVVAVGGSTTECYYLSDGKDWPSCLTSRLGASFASVWVNNAGLDGHSTFGHLKLVDDYLFGLSPRIILYLVGANDVGRSDLNEFDREMLKERHTGVFTWVQRYSEICNTSAQVIQRMKPQQFNAGHFPVDLKAGASLSDAPGGIEQALQEHRKAGFVDRYEERLLELIARTKAMGAVPVMITQPTLAGNAIDPSTGVNLAAVDCGDKISGLNFWSVLELYNDCLRRLCSQQDIPLIDLSRTLPKDSRYYYDWLHFTNEGAEAVGEIVNQGLRPILEKRFPQFRRK
jgi:lysophospholipase L1-like esterase